MHLAAGAAVLLDAIKRRIRLAEQLLPAFSLAREGDADAQRRIRQAAALPQHGVGRFHFVQHGFPHIGEFSRLSGRTAAEIQDSPVALAEDFAGKHGVILLLKGPGTIVTDGSETWITDRGTPGMATAGSGDVLSGILAAVAAAHPIDLLKAAAGAAWINGRAGETAAGKYGEAAMTAGDTAGSTAEVVRVLETTERLVRK